MVVGLAVMGLAVTVDPVGISAGVAVVEACVLAALVEAAALTSEGATVVKASVLATVVEAAAVTSAGAAVVEAAAAGGPSLRLSRPGPDSSASLQNAIVS